MGSIGCVVTCQHAAAWSLSFLGRCLDEAAAALLAVHVWLTPASRCTIYYCQVYSGAVHLMGTYTEDAEFSPACLLNHQLCVCRELIRQHAVNNTVVVTWANYHYRDFALNWAEHLEAAGAPSGHWWCRFCLSRILDLQLSRAPGAVIGPYFTPLQSADKQCQ